MSDDGVRVDMPHIFKWFQSTANVERLAIKSNHSSFNYNQIYLHILLLNTNEKTSLYVTEIYVRDICMWKSRISKLAEVQFLTLILLTYFQCIHKL